VIRQEPPNKVKNTLPFPRPAEHAGLLFWKHKAEPKYTGSVTLQDQNFEVIKMKKLMVIAISLTTAFSGVPAFAGPTGPVSLPAVQAENAEGIVKVGCNNGTNCPQINPRWGNGHHYRGGDRWEGRRHYRNWDDRRHYRDGYYRDRRHGNAGAVIGGLAAGALIGGLIASQPAARSYGGSHVEYCASKYRSYRASDNTYQPLNGPRRQCR